MTCFYPIDAWDRFGEIVFHEPKEETFPPFRKFQVPCGRCIGCRIDRSKDWALRCVLEASLHAENCFVTLTYDNDHLPENGSLVLEDLQKFIKRLRKKFPERIIRYYACGEYGSERSRPHYHLCLFGFDFPDKRVWSKGDTQGSFYYRSADLESLWRFGYSIIGEVTYESAAYVARYINKKILGDKDLQDQIYQGRKPEFSVMSRRPGIASNFFEHYQGDVFPKDFITMNGKRFKPSRYFDKLYKKINEPEYIKLKEKRIESAIQHIEDNTGARLEARRCVLEEKLKRCKRGFEEK